MRGQWRRHLHEEGLGALAVGVEQGDGGVEDGDRGEEVHRSKEQEEEGRGDAEDPSRGLLNLVIPEPVEREVLQE